MWVNPAITGKRKCLQPAVRTDRVRTLRRLTSRSVQVTRGRSKLAPGPTRARKKPPREQGRRLTCNSSRRPRRTRPPSAGLPRTSRRTRSKPTKPIGRNQSLQPNEPTRPLNYQAIGNRDPNSHKPHLAFAQGHGKPPERRIERAEITRREQGARARRRGDGKTTGKRSTTPVQDQTIDSPVSEAKQERKTKLTTTRSSTQKPSPKTSRQRRHQKP